MKTKAKMHRKVKRGRVKPVLFGHHYKTRKTSGEFVRLYEYRQIRTKRGNTVYRWVCIAVGTRALHGIADTLNLLPPIR